MRFLLDNYKEKPSTIVNGTAMTAIGEETACLRAQLVICCFVGSSSFREGNLTGTAASMIKKLNVIRCDTDRKSHRYIAE